MHLVIFKPFDIVKIPFPFTDQEKSKLRPALVISSQIYGQTTDHLILVMITTAKDSRWHNDVEIQDFQACQLPALSKIRFKIFTLDRRFIVGKVGVLDINTINMVKVRLKEVFGLD